MAAGAQIEVAGVERFDIVEKILGPVAKRNPKQIAYLHALFDEHKEFILYGGAAGGGKSYILRWSEFIFLLFAWKRYGVRNVRAGLFCEDYPSLKDRQLSRIKMEFPSALGEMCEDRDLGLIWQLNDSAGHPNDLGGGFIAPRNLDKPSKYDSTEFAMIGIDELTKNPPDVFDELNKRLRWPGFPKDFVFPFVGATNPGGIGHGWVKAYWIEREFPPHLKQVADHFAFIQAKATENKYNPPNYVRDKLDTLPEQLRRAYRDGDWDVFLGQYFGEWRKTIHVCPRFRIPHYWTRFTAEDWGFAKPWCRLWFAVSPEGRVIAYREQYETMKLPQYMAETGLKYSEGEDIRYRLGDPAMWQHTRKTDGSVGPSIAEQLAEHGWQIVAANNDRIPGWQHTRAFLQWEKNRDGKLVREPMFQVMDGTCPNLIRTMPVQVFDKLDPEDLDTEGEDHAPDTLRYGLMSRPRPTIVPLEEMADEWTEAALRAAHVENRAASKRGGVSA